MSSEPYLTLRIWLLCIKMNEDADKIKWAPRFELRKHSIPQDQVADGWWGGTRHIAIVISYHPSFIPDQFFVIKSYRLYPSPLAATVPHHLPLFHQSRDVIAAPEMVSTSSFHQAMFLRFRTDPPYLAFHWMLHVSRSEVEKESSQGSKWTVEGSRVFQLWVTNEPICFRHWGVILKTVMERAKHRKFGPATHCRRKMCWEGQDHRMLSSLKG